ncbi:TPA: helix-turn-helix domain-containing protein [Bacillus cereus]|uniref:BglG family transcription antiterminator n=1 Tax=Bacillus sp. FSL M8-0139 TaxID=2921613 RepID=UPI0030F63EF0|nr:helix-turn-helix domain-containing protein [Bacillus cereus]
MFMQQRRQEIINILLQDQKWHRLEEIADQVHCAVKTVRRDLYYLKDQLPSDWRIQVIKGKGVKLYKPPHSSQTSIYSFFKREDMQFRILAQLLQGDIHTVAQLADTLYVQISTLSPVLRSIQKYLRYFDLELLKKPLRIVGKEAHIVYMFYELYFTTYGWEEWPFPEEIGVFSYISQIEKQLDIQFYPSYKQRFAYLLAVAIRRKKQGYQMKILSIHEALIMETSFYSKIKTLPSTLCGISLTKADQVLITIAVNCCMFVHSNRNQFKQEILQQFYTGESIVYQYAQDLVERLELVFDTTFCQDEEFLFCLLQYIRKISYRYQFIPTITSPTLEWHEQIKQKHATTFQKVCSVYTLWVKEHPFIFRANEEDILAITLQLEATFQLSQKYRKKVLLYLGDSILWSRYIQGVLYHEFGNNLFIVPEEVLDIYKCELQKLDIDGIISTIPLEKIQLPIFQISVVPTRRELDDIQIFLSTE